MSSGTILILSSSAALQTRHFLSPVGAKECWFNTEGHRVHQAGRLKTNRSTVAKAGLGRYSGAVHGNSKKRSRTRRPPDQQDEEPEECDQHEESTSRSLENLAETKGQSDESTEGHGDAAEGFREEFTADGSSDSSLQSSYNRYLMELGVSPTPQQDSESQKESSDFLRTFHGLQNGSSSDEDSQMSHQGDLQEIGIVSSQKDSEGRGRDLGTELTKEVNIKRATDAERQSGEIEKELDIKLENEGKSESEGIPLDGTTPVAASEFQALDLFLETSSLGEDEGTVLGHDGRDTDRIADTKMAGEPDSVSDGGATKKKRRKKPKAKAVASSFLKSEERGDNGSVRASLNEAERPAVRFDEGSEEVSFMNGSVRGSKEGEGLEAKEDFGTNESSKTASTTESSLDFSPVAELADRDGQGSNVLGSLVNSQSAHTDGQSSIALDSLVDSQSADTDEQSSIALDSVVDSKSTSDINNEDKSAESNLQHTPLSVFGKAGAIAVSKSQVAADEPEELMVSRMSSVVGAQPAPVGSQVIETDLEQAVQTAAKVVPVESVEKVASKVAELPVVVVEQAAQVGGQVVDILPDVVTEQVSQVADVVTEQVSQVADVVTEQVSQVAEVVTEQVSQVAEVVTEQVSQVAEVVTEQVSQVAEVVTEQVNQVAEAVTEQVSQVVDNVTEFAEQVGNVVEHVSDVAEQVANTVNEQVEQVAESVSNTASQVVETVSQGVDNVTSSASQVVDQVTDFFTSDEDDDSDSDDEFEAYITSDRPEFRGKEGLDNFIVRQEHQGVLSKIYDFYSYMLKQSLPKFAAAMFATPVLVSGIFTLLYLPEFDGLAFDETARDFFAANGGDSMTSHISWKTIFQVFMFSLSLSTGLQPELAPLSPYTLIVANLNALVAQLVFVFLSGAVFARLSQPSQPLRCSTVALVSASPAQRRRKENPIKVFMARYVLAGPQPCELVDVKVDLTYKYNTHTRTGSFFRATQTLKLVRPEIAFLTYGMLVRHVIDENSPLYQRTPEMLNKEDAVFSLSVVGLERASMQSVFHVQHYCVVDNDVIWNAEFEDLILINKKDRRVVDHSRLSSWRPVM